MLLPHSSHASLPMDMELQNFDHNEAQGHESMGNSTRMYGTKNSNNVRYCFCCSHGRTDKRATLRCWLIGLLIVGALIAIALGIMYGNGMLGRDEK